VNIDSDLDEYTLKALRRVRVADVALDCRGAADVHRYAQHTNVPSRIIVVPLTLCVVAVGPL